MLRRYWIEFERDLAGSLPLGTLLGVGVTAYDYEDALSLVGRSVFDGDPLPPITKVVEDVDVSNLDPRNVLPNIRPPNWRGVWFPMV